MNNNIKIVAHRGDRKTRVENTIEACELALSLGATSIEVDLRQTASGEIVVFHDFSLKRMFNKSGYVGRTPYNVLKTYPYVKVGQEKDQYIDLLDSFLDYFKDRISINLDAKTIHFFDFDFADKIISTVNNHNLFETVWISCFNPFLLQILRLKSKKIKTAYLFQNMSWMHTTYDIISWTNAWHPHYHIVDEKLINKALKNKKEIYVWTANEIPILKQLIQYPINGIITDDVAMVKNFLSNQR